jgi:hypothetical protein
MQQNSVCTCKQQSLILPNVCTAQPVGQFDLDAMVASVAMPTTEALLSKPALIVQPLAVNATQADVTLLSKTEFAILPISQPKPNLTLTSNVAPSDSTATVAIA